jgi:4-hydroxy-4-methyl-2-oxoglutarate aldolase
VTAIDIKVIESLTGWDTPALSNALDTLLLRPYHTGHSHGSIQGSPEQPRWPGARSPREWSPGNPATTASPYHTCTRPSQRPTARSSWSWETATTPAGAGAFLGEVNGSLLAALGVKGVITNCQVRDIPELRGLGYAVYAAGLCVAHAYMRLVDVGTEVTVAGLTVRPGDVLHANEHGVLRIPADALPDIIEKAELIREDEQKVVGWSRSADFSVGSPRSPATAG